MTLSRWREAGMRLAFSSATSIAPLTFVDRALLLNPNLATAWVLSGW